MKLHNCREARSCFTFFALFTVLAFCGLLFSTAGAVGAEVVGTTPIIDSVDGEFTNGGTLVIDGSLLGIKAKAAPVRYDNFESGTVGQRLEEESASSGWYTSYTKSSVGPTSYSTERVRYPDAQSARQQFRDGNYNQYVTLGETTFGALNTKTLYVSGWFYLTTGGEPSANVKLLNMGAGEGWQSRVDQYPKLNSGHMFAHNGPSTGGSTEDYIHDWSIGGDLHEGAWHRIETWLDLGTANGNDGYRNLVLDGQKIAEIAGNMITEEFPIGELQIGHYFCLDERSPTATATRYWDELYVDVSMARVEIGDNSNWSACTHREIQISTAWSADSISVNINQGSFSPGDTAYLYVVDADGNVNADGYPITIATLDTYTVSYNGNGQTSGAVPSDQVKTHGTDLILANNIGTLAKTGFTFAGWNTSADGTGTDYAEGATYTADAALTLYAKWTEVVATTPIID